MTDDAQLLGRFLAGEEAAFGGLVRGHIDFVYRAALREVNGDAHLAQDVTQAVFLMLARKARDLEAYRALTGWLYSTTRYCAREAIRKDRRWRNREKEALAMSTQLKESVTDSDWKALGPVLDDALHELDAADREVVLLRYYENQPYAEVGARIGLAKNSARMRVERALEKLRQRLERRGVTSTAAALGVVLAGQPAISAPAALAGTVIQLSLAGAAVGGGVAGTTVFIMSTTKLAVAALVLAAFVGGGYYAGANRAPVQVVSADPQTERLRDQITRLRNENRDLALELQRERGNVPTAGSTSTAPSGRPAPVATMSLIPELLDPVAATETSKYNSISNNLRQLNAAARQFRLENKGRDPTYDELVGPTGYVKSLKVVDSEDYTTMSFAANDAMTVRTASGLEVSYGGTAQQMQMSPSPYAAAVTEATNAFRAATGRPPTGFELAAYIENPGFRTEYLGKMAGQTLMRSLGEDFAPKLQRAAKIYAAAYEAAHGAKPPETLQAIGRIAPYFESDADRERFQAEWSRLQQEAATK